MNGGLHAIAGLVRIEMGLGVELNRAADEMRRHSLCIGNGLGLCARWEDNKRRLGTDDQFQVNELGRTIDVGELMRETVHGKEVDSAVHVHILAVPTSPGVDLSIHIGE